MGATITSTVRYNPAAPTDLRVVDRADDPTPSAAAIATVLALVDRVCGPDSDVARMLGLEATS